MSRSFAEQLWAEEWEDPVLVSEVTEMKGAGLNL